jgi:glucuronate isomerase
LGCNNRYIYPLWVVAVAVVVGRGLNVWITMEMSRAFIIVTDMLTTSAGRPVSNASKSIDHKNNMALYDISTKSRWKSIVRSRLYTAFSARSAQN